MLTNVHVSNILHFPPAFKKNFENMFFYGQCNLFYQIYLYNIRKKIGEPQKFNYKITKNPSFSDQMTSRKT